MNILTVYSCNYWQDDVQHEKATKVNEKKPMIRNVISSTYTKERRGMMGDNVCLSFIHTERDLQNLELLPLPSPFLFFRSSFLSTLLFFKLKSHPISIHLGYYYSVRYLHTQNLLELIENGNILNIMFAPAFFYTLAQR